jgi:GTPase SAR1 family protein
MSLIPEKRSIPAQRLQDYHVLIFGEAGAGKTSLASQFPGALFAATEMGTKALSVFQVNIAKRAKKEGKLPWVVFRELVEEFVEGDHDFETFVIDTEDVLYEWCLDYITDKLNGHPGTHNDFGASWAKLKSEFKEPHEMIKNAGYGLVSVSHAQYREIEDIEGKKRDKLMPTVGGSSSAYLIDDSDIIILYRKDSEGNRVMSLEPTNDFTGKQRIRTFAKKDISAGNSSKEAFKNFQKEFEKAMKNLNAEEGISDEDIEEFYTRKKKEKEEKTFKQLINDIAAKCQKLGLSKKDNAKEMKEKYGTPSLGKLTYEQAQDRVEELKGRL